SGTSGIADRVYRIGTHVWSGLPVPRPIARPPGCRMGFLRISQSPAFPGDARSLALRQVGPQSICKSLWVDPSRPGRPPLLSESPSVLAHGGRVTGGTGTHHRPLLAEALVDKLQASLG